MNFARSSFQVFKSCRASPYPSTLAHTVGCRHTRLSRLGTRCYSEEKTTEKPPSTGEELDKEDASAKEDLCAEVKNKLKAKEDEATDLMVSNQIFQSNNLIV